MPCLILINGPPACGKSTMARMYAAGHPLALVLDIDRVRGCLGRWGEDLPSASRAARAIAQPRPGPPTSPHTTWPATTAATRTWQPCMTG